MAKVVKKNVIVQFSVDVGNKVIEWTPKVMERDGVMFARFDKWDRSLVSFVLGQKRNKDIHINCAAWDLLYNAKQAAMNEALKVAMGWNSQDFQRKKVRNATSSDISLLPSVLTVEVFGINVQILPEDGMKYMWVACMNEDVIARIRQELHDSCERCEWSTFKKRGQNKRKVAGSPSKRKRRHQRTPAQKENAEHEADAEQVAANTDANDSESREACEAECPEQCGSSPSATEP